jgi:hypothetical protein
LKNHLARLALAAAATLSPLANAQPDPMASFQQLVAAASETSLRSDAEAPLLQAANVVPVAEHGMSFTAAGPDPSIAWLMALGFLGLVIVRRTR